MLFFAEQACFVQAKEAITQIDEYAANREHQCRNAEGRIVRYWAASHKTRLSKLAGNTKSQIRGEKQ